MNKIYKAAITNIVKGKNIGTCVLCQDFDSMNAAIEEAKTHIVGEKYSLEVREYDVAKGCIIAFGSEADTGTTVYLVKEVAA